MFADSAVVRMESDCMKSWLIVALLFSVVPQTTQPVDTVLERLAKVQLFAFGGVGYAGVMSSGEKDYRILLSRTSAMADFEKLYSQGNVQAKCYALVGIEKLNPARFRELAGPSHTSKEKVGTMYGCITFTDETFVDIIRKIESGEYRDQHASTH